MNEHTADSLNPRGAASKQMEMSVRRAWALSSLCRQAFDAAGANLERAYRAFPCPSATSEVEWLAPRKTVKFVFGEPMYVGRREHEKSWREYMDAWYAGSLERQIETGLALVPSTVRNKLRVYLDADPAKAD
jgi:hypothetical protein